MNDLMRAYGFVSAHKSEFDKYFPTMGTDLRAAQKNENFSPANIMQDMNNLLKLVQVYDEYHIAPVAAQQDLQSYFSGNVSATDLLKQYTEKDIILQSDKDAALEKLKSATVITKVFPNIEYLIIEDQLKVSDKGLLADLEVLKNIANKCLQQLRGTTDEKLKQRIQDNINTYNNDLTRMNAQQLYDAYFKIINIDIPKKPFNSQDVKETNNINVHTKITIPHSKVNNRGFTLTDAQINSIKVINLTIHDMKNTPESEKAGINVPSIMPKVKQIFPKLVNFVDQQIAIGCNVYSQGTLKNEIFNICKTISKFNDKGTLDSTNIRNALEAAFNEWIIGRSWSSIRFNTKRFINYQSEQAAKDEVGKAVFEKMDQMAQKYGFCLFDNQQYDQFMKMIEFSDKLSKINPEKGEKAKKILNKIQQELTTLYQDYYVQRKSKKRYMDLSTNYWLRSEDVKVLLLAIRQAGMNIQQKTTNQYCPIEPSIWNKLTYDQRLFVEFLDKTCQAISDKKQILPLAYAWYKMQGNGITEATFEQRCKDFNDTMIDLVRQDIRSAMEYRKKELLNLVDEFDSNIRKYQDELKRKLPLNCQRVIATGSKDIGSTSWLDGIVSRLKTTIENKHTYMDLSDVIKQFVGAVLSSEGKAALKKNKKLEEDFNKRMQELQLNNSNTKLQREKNKEYNKRTSNQPNNEFNTDKQFMRQTLDLEYQKQQHNAALTKNMRRLARKIS